VGISRQRSSFYKAEQVKYRGTRPQFPLPFLSLAFIHTSLSRMGSDQAAGKRAGGVHYGNRERSRSIYTSRTHSQASLMVLHYTTLVPPLRLCIGPAREAGLSTGTWRGTCHLVKKRKKKRPFFKVNPVKPAPDHSKIHVIHCLHFHHHYETVTSYQFPPFFTVDI